MRIRPGILIAIVAVFAVLIGGRFLGWYGGKPAEPASSTESPAAAPGDAVPPTSETPRLATTPPRPNPARPLPAMLRQSVQELPLPAQGRGLHEFTDAVERLVEDSGLRTGLVTLHLQHTSASLLIQENADPEVCRDLERFFARLVPDGDPLFQHTSEGDDDMPAHVRTALTTVNLSIPIVNGQLDLGTWQGIYLWEHRLEPHRRRVIVHLLGE